jgi:benzylsuccinate CoA-transferase BbsF subunit
MPNSPLAGVRVADFTWVIAGPSITKNLALLGAEVIRIESAKRAEYRNRGGNFALLNDNKKSCALDLSQTEAREIAKAIISRSDVVVENFGLGVMNRLGLDYETLREIKPDIIMLSCSGLGRSGPDSDKLAFGTLLQLFSGWSLIQGHPETRDVLIGGAWTDPITALHGTFAILSALYHKQQTGLGQYIDLSMAEATLCGLPETIMDYSMNQRLPVRFGNSDPILAPHGCYPCAGDDEWVAICVSTDAEWEALCEAMGCPSWAQGARFADMVRRKQHEAELNCLIAEWTQNFSAYQVMEKLQSAGVAAGPSLNAAQLLEDPHLKERAIFVDTTSPSGEQRTTIGATWRISPSFEPSYSPAPRLGQDNQYVLEKLVGMDQNEVERLIESKVAY